MPKLAAGALSAIYRQSNPDALEQGPKIPGVFPHPFDREYGIEGGYGQCGLRLARGDVGTDKLLEFLEN